MPPKKAETVAAPAKKSSNPSYQDMITDAITGLKDRNGSSRQSLKKYVRAQNDIKVTDKMFDSLFNKTLKNGVDKGIFEQPKGPSGGTKLAKKVPKKDEKAPAKKPVAKKATTSEKKTTTTTAAAAKKATTAKKPVAEKKAAPKKAAATKDKKPAAKKAAAAPAVTEKPTTLTKTKSGRVAKTTAPKAAPKKAAPKKASAKA